MNNFTACFSTWSMFIKTPVNQGRRLKNKFWSGLCNHSINQFNQGQPWLSQGDADTDFDD